MRIRFLSESSLDMPLPRRVFQALEVHGTMENIAIARIKKAKYKEKIAATKSSKEKRLQQGVVFPPIGSGFEAHLPAPIVPHTGHVGVHHATVIDAHNVFP
jgi:hypothetical protein